MTFWNVAEKRKGGRSEKIAREKNDSAGGGGEKRERDFPSGGKIVDGNSGKKASS